MITKEDLSSMRVKLAIVITVFATIFPALWLTGFLPGGDQLSLVMYYSTAVVGGGIGGLLLAQPKIGLWWQMALCGIITGASILTVAMVYMRFRDSIYKLELILIVILGAIPGLLFYTFFVRKKNNS